MAYEVFTRKVNRSGSPTIGFSKLGQLQFNQSAARILQKDAIEHVLLLWDPATRHMAVKSISNKKDPRAYHIKYLTQGNGAGFSAKTFLDYIGVDITERRSVPVEINTNNDMLIEVELPENFFKKKSPLQPRIVKGQGG